LAVFLFLAFSDLALSAIFFFSSAWFSGCCAVIFVTLNEQRKQEKISIMKFATYGILKTNRGLEICNSHYERETGAMVQGKNGDWGSLVVFKTEAEQRAAWNFLLKTWEAEKRAAARFRRKLERAQTLAFYAQISKELSSQPHAIFSEREYYTILATGF